MNHADQVMSWLNELGYTHCFFVAGGNIMHLLDGARTRFTCVPVVHEVAAGIAAEYFNALRQGENFIDSQQKALLKSKLDSYEQEFSDNPVYVALMKAERESQSL